MDMETAQICQESLEYLSGREQDFVNALYQEVFERAPEIREVFSVDIDSFQVRQGTLLRMGMVLLDHPERLGGRLRELGKDHKAYGVRPHHYDVVQQAVIDVLAWYLGEEGWNDRFAEAWRTLIGFVASEMAAGARGQAA